MANRKQNGVIKEETDFEIYFDHAWTNFHILVCVI